MANASVKTEATIVLDREEAWALRNALGNMCVNAWKTAGLHEQDIERVTGVFMALDAALHEGHK